MREEATVPPGAGRVSILDVAARAGVSAATVSRSLRGLAKVAPNTRLRVLEAARELSYVTPTAAVGAGPDRTIAIIVPFVTRWFFSTVIGAAVDTLRERGYDVLLYHVGDADRRDDFFERMPLAGRVAGVLTVSMPLSEDHTLALRASDIAMVSVGVSTPGSPSVRIDDEAAARSAVHHLLHLRHERIGYISGTGDDPRFDFSASSERVRGCREALRHAGLTLSDDLLVSGPHSLEGGAAAMAELLSRPVLPTAVLAEYDELAIGALWALRRAGLSVPGDISVIGIDDHEMAAMLDLTTVAQDVRGQGRIAAELLVATLTGDTDRPTDRPVLVPTRLVLRSTTGQRPGPTKVAVRQPARRSHSTG